MVIALLSVIVKLSALGDGGLLVYLTFGCCGSATKCSINRSLIIQWYDPWTTVLNQLHTGPRLQLDGILPLLSVGVGASSKTAGRDLICHARPSLSLGLTTVLDLLECVFP